MGTLLRQNLLIAACLAVSLAGYQSARGQAAVTPLPTDTNTLQTPASGVVTAPLSAPDAGALPAATEKPKARHKKPAAAAAAKGSSFHGTLAKVDRVNMTISVDGSEHNALKITSNTRVYKDGKPALLADGTVGEPVSGTVIKGKDGSEEAATLNFGAKKSATAEAKPATHKPRKAKAKKATTDTLAPATDTVPATPTPGAIPTTPPPGTPNPLPGTPQ